MNEGAGIVSTKKEEVKFKVISNDRDENDEIWHIVDELVLIEPLIPFLFGTFSF